MKTMIKYCILQSLFWMLFCSCYGYITFYMLGRGFSANSIGIVTAVFGLLGAFFQPVFGRLIDNGVLTWKVLSFILILVILFCSILLIIFQNSLIQGLLFGITLSCLNACLPLINRASFICQTDNQKINFGIARGFGSLSYAILSLILGRLSVIFDCTIVPVSICIISAFMLLVLFFMPNGHIVDFNFSNTSHYNSLSLLIKYPVFTIMFISCIFQMIFHNLTNTYLINICERAGGTSSTLGVALAIAAVIELPIMFFFTKINKFISAKALLQISAIAFFAKSIGYYFSVNIPILYGIQLLQIASFAIYASASVYYAEVAVKESDKTTAQAFMSSTQTIGSVFGCLMGGFIISSFNLNAMLLAGILIAAIGSFFAFAAHPKN